jgi:two-component system sensor histidine kinase/response regulator
MNDFVSKPFEPRELFKVLARWLPRSGTAQAPTAGAVDGLAAGAAPAVSFALGLHRCMGRRDLYTRVLRQFVESHGADATGLRQALQRDQMALAARLAHTLLSAAGAIGAEALVAATSALQPALAPDPGPSLPELLQAFEHEHARVMAELHAHLRPQGDPAAPAFP